MFNVLFVVNQHYPYGMAGTLRIKLFAEYIERKSKNVKVLISNQDNGQNEQSGSHNGVHYSTLVSNNIPKLIFFMIYPFVTFYQLMSFKQSNVRNIIVIYGDVDMFTLPFVLIGKLLGYHVLLDIVEDRILSEERSTLKGKINSWFREVILPYGMKFVDGLVVISRYLENKYKVLFPDMPLVIIPVSAANLDIESKDYEMSKEYVNVVYCGSFGIKDGLDYLIDAFNHVSTKYSNLRLILLGKAKQEIKDKISCLGNENIKLAGYLPDEEYWKTLHNADILCMTRIDSPFAQAGFPFKLGEYLATGKPVIATDVSDVKYYLDDKKDVVMAKPSDTQSLINAFEYLIEYPEKRDFIGANGYEKCKQYFNPEVNSQILFDFINKI